MTSPARSRELLFSLNDIKPSGSLPCPLLLFWVSAVTCLSFPGPEFGGNCILIFVVRKTLDDLDDSCLLHPSLYIDFLLSVFFFNKSIFAWQKMPCIEIQASMKHRFSLVELKHSKSLSKLQLKWYIQNVLNQMFAFHLHFGFYSKSSEIYFRVLKMSFSSRQDLTSVAHGWCFGGFFHRLASGFMHFEASSSSTVHECPEPDHKGYIHAALWPWTWHLCTKTAQWMMGGACTKMAAQTLLCKRSASQVTQ